MNLSSHPSSARFEWRRFTREESPSDFERALRLRYEIFVEEQSVPPEEEQDDYDDEAVHWLCWDTEGCEPVATGRLLSYQEACQTRPVAKIGRLAVKKTLRGQKLGHLLMQSILEVAQEDFAQAILDAQVQALPFYEKLGFVSEGDRFLDAGIWHYRMRLVF